MAALGTLRRCAAHRRRRFGEGARRARDRCGVCSRAVLSARTMIAIAAGAITLGAALPATAVALYAATPTGNFGGAPSVGYGLNSHGHVTGYTSRPPRAFIFANGVLLNLGALGAGVGASSFGHAINDSGDVVGTLFNCSPFCGNHGMLYANGAMQQLPPIFTSAVCYGINASSQIVGEAFDTFPASPRYAFVRTGSAFARLGTLGGTISRGRAINDAGQVTGAAAIAGDAAEHAFLHMGGPMVDLGTLGGTNSIGNSINAGGQVAGASDLPGNTAQHAFLWTGGTMVDLGTLGGASSVAYGINALGQVVGTAATAGNASQRAFLYDRGRMYDLNALVIFGLGTDPLTEARGINNAGEIVANACGLTGCQAYLLTRAGEVEEVTEVPALSHLALIVLAALLAGAGLSHRAKSRP